MNSFLPLLALFSTSAALAASPRFDHAGTSAEIEAAVRANQAFHGRSASLSPLDRPLHPVEDTANFAYVLMSGYDQGEAEVMNLRESIARNLPAKVKLVLLAEAGDAEQLRRQYLQWISEDRLIVATDPTAQGGFWARDSFPVPVYDTASGKTSLVAAHYYREFSGWDAIAEGVNATIAKKDFTFVGGNLLSDEEGNCFSVDSYRLFTITQDDLKQAYGCRNVHLMKHVRGLGDVDEVLKPLPGHRMLTNSPEYKADLESWGYQVILLPLTPGAYRTYVNSLVVQNLVFMPTYGVLQDAVAQKVYENLGYRVVPIRTNRLSDVEHGSIHCQTMAYPPMSSSALLQALGRQEFLAPMGPTNR